MAITNWTEYFREERDVYCKNCSSCQVSVTFDVGGGRSESYTFASNKDPVNLSRFIPFQAIKSSLDFRKMLNRQPLTLVLLTEEEYLQHFQKVADTHKISVDAAMDLVEQRRIAAANHLPLPDAPEPVKLHTVVEDGKEFGTRKVVRSEVQADESELNSRVLHLCLQVHQSVPDQEKMSAQAFLAELDDIPDTSMTMSDWEYVQSHGYYKSVKATARKHIAELAASEDLGEEDVEVAPAPPAPKKKAKKPVSPTV